MTSEKFNLHLENNRKSCKLKVENPRISEQSCGGCKEARTGQIKKKFESLVVIAYKIPKVEGIHDSFFVNKVSE